MRMGILVGLCLTLSLALGCNGEPEETTPKPTTAHVYPLDDQLRLHHAQVRGTHNSYHVEPETAVHDSHRYSHAPLDVQLGTQHVRTFELDLHRIEDTFEVFHLQLVDEETTCRTFTGCLEVIRTWSVSKPDHLPIFVWMELKSGMDDNAFESLLLIEDEIRSVLPDEQLLTPELVRGDYANVKEALLAEGWPTLGLVRGRVMFILLSGGAHVEPYTHGLTSLDERLIFPRADGNQFDMPWAAVTKLGPVSHEIVPAIEAGMLVAANVCNADETDEHCSSELGLSLENGIHMLKDDFPYPVEEREYWLELPDGPVASCHPLTAPAECTGEALEWIEP